MGDAAPGRPAPGLRPRARGPGRRTNVARLARSRRPSSGLPGPGFGSGETPCKKTWRTSRKTSPPFSDGSSWSARIRARGEARRLKTTPMAVSDEPSGSRAGDGDDRFGLSPARPTRLVAPLSVGIRNGEHEERRVEEDAKGKIEQPHQTLDVPTVAGEAEIDLGAGIRNGSPGRPSNTSTSDYRRKKQREGSASRTSSGNRCSACALAHARSLSHTRPWFTAANLGPAPAGLMKKESQEC